jgi:hypothetical protein
MKSPLDDISIEHARHKLWLSLCDRILDTPDEYAALTADERFYFVVRRFEGEVNNGGFEQYFYNSAGDNYHEALAGLKLLGAHHAAALLERAAELVFDGEAPPADRNERNMAMSSGDCENAPWWSDEVDGLEEAFYDEPDKLKERLAQFALKKGLLTPFLS